MLSKRLATHELKASGDDFGYADFACLQLFRFLAELLIEFQTIFHQKRAATAKSLPRYQNNLVRKTSRFAFDTKPVLNFNEFVANQMKT